MKEQIMTVSVGDHVRLTTRADNQHQSYQINSSQVAFLREPADGLILSIRDISTGNLIASTKERMDKYVVELIFDNTFNPRYASLRNVARTIERVTAAPSWRRMQVILRDMAGKGQLISTAAPNFVADGPQAKLLDGWKVIKVYSNELTSLEKVTPAEAELS